MIHDLADDQFRGGWPGVDQEFLFVERAPRAGAGGTRDLTVATPPRRKSWLPPTVRVASKLRSKLNSVNAR